MKAWNIDANSININDINTNHLNSIMIRTKEIDDFLLPDTNKMFVVAPKGLGKTYLLKIKSQLYRDSAKGFKFIPENTLCEKFTSAELSFSEKDLNRFKEKGTWKKTWEICLYSLILRCFKSKSIPNEILNVIGEDTGSLSEILGTLLQNRGSIEKLHQFVSKSLKPAVRKLKEESAANQVAIFIDSVDEAFDNFVGFEASNNGKMLSADVWIYGQLALLSVAKDICSTNPHIKIFLTIRSEAYNHQQNQQMIQTDDLCVFLRYSKDQIKEIFIQNIRLSEPQDLINPESDDVISRLLGYNKVNHKFVIDQKGNKATEMLFDFMYRHTYARPREIVLMGKRIIELNNLDKKNSDKVGSTVNLVSYALFEYLKNEIIPVFEQKIFDEFCQKVTTNVLRYEEAFRIYEYFRDREDNKFDNIFSYFYRLGLIGIVENEINREGGYMKQTFLPVGQYTLIPEKIPECKYFIVHPSLNKKMKQLHDVGFYDRFNIIGYDNPFYLNKSKSFDNHIHFGLDRDSLTILIPELEASKCIAVVANPNAEWRELEKSETFILSLNGRDISFKVYTDLLNDLQKKEILLGWQEKRFSVLVYSNTSIEILPFFLNTKTITVCWYRQYLPVILELLHLRGVRDQLLIYLCSREHSEDDFKDFQRNITDINSLLTCESVIIDRFQYSQEENIFIPDEKILKSTIISETYGSVICKQKNDLLLKNGEILLKVHNEIEIDFYLKRQNFIVEAIYQFYKIIAFEYNSTNKDFELIFNEFIRIQVARLTQNYNDNELHLISQGKTRITLENDLIKFANKTLDRVKNLDSRSALNKTTKDVELNKNKKIFPTDDEFYEMIRRSPNFYNSTFPFLELIRLLNINNSEKYYNLFISYSYKDRSTVNTIYERLRLWGVKIKMYEKDNPLGALITYMESSVLESGRMLFIASENSLTSDPCHFELKTCREFMRQKNDRKKLIAVRLDDYVLKVNYNDIHDKDRSENIKLLRESINVNRYNAFTDNMNLRALENELVRMINEKIKII